MFHLIRKNDSLIGRIFLLALITIFLSVLFTGSVLFWTFYQSQQRALHNYLSAYTDILIAATSLDEKGTVRLDQSHDVFKNMPFYWQITKNNQLLAKSELMKNTIYTEGLDSQKAAIRINHDDVEIIAVSKDVSFPGNQNLTYTFGLPAAIAQVFLEQETAKFTSTLFIVLALSGLFLLSAIVALQLRATIRPLRAIQNEISFIQDGKEIELNTHFPREIRILAQAINKLLNHNRSIIERYRTFSANLSHALRTPLTVIRNEVQQTSEPMASSIIERVDEMTTLIERNLSRVQMVGAYAGSQDHININEIAEKILRNYGKLYGKNYKIDNKAPALDFQGNESDFVEILGHIIENACQHASSAVSVIIEEEQSHVTITIEDDGKGMNSDEINRALQYGVRLDENTPGSGIGLAVTKDIVNLYKGYITFGSALLGGLEVRITVPQGDMNFE